MSIGQTFPDAIVFPDGIIRLLSVDAKSWAYSNTKLKDYCTVNTVADYVVFDCSVPQMMSDDGLVVRYAKHTVWQYKDRRKAQLKTGCAVVTYLTACTP